jgi:hypothetical protein
MQLQRLLLRPPLIEKNNFGLRRPFFCAAL